jgi:hypothetical protein
MYRFPLAEFMCSASLAIRVLFLIGWIYLHSIACHQSTVSHWLNLSAQHRLPSECFPLAEFICTASLAISVPFLNCWIYLHQVTGQCCTVFSLAEFHLATSPAIAVYHFLTGGFLLNLSAQCCLSSEYCFSSADFICTQVLHLPVMGCFSLAKFFIICAV